MKRYLFVVILIFSSNNSGFSQTDVESTFEMTIDSLMQVGIDSQAFPGAQLLVQHKGEVIFHKAYGHHTYEAEREVHLDDIYDMASVTKVTTGLPLLMKLHAKGLFDLNTFVEEYLPIFKRSSIGQMTYKDILSHGAGLQPYIVFWRNAQRKNGKYRWKTFKSEPSEDYPIEITPNLFLHRNYKRKMMKQIRKSEVNENTEYRYSGLMFLTMPDLIENISGLPFEQMLYDSLFTPMGLLSTGYKPLRRHPKESIVPTERDTFWRKILVHGHVHDEAAAMLNGVSCNAGLFSNATDMAKLFQMYLNCGVLNGDRFLDSLSVKSFTTRHLIEEDNRRGLGFDKPPLEYVWGDSYVAESASPSSFGHSGFTGTMVWADPEYDLVFVFLSNRVYPDRSKRHLYTLDLRPQMHQVAYDWIRNDSVE